MSTYRIVYPGGNRRRLAVVEICDGMEYEVTDYDLASREDWFTDHADAMDHARRLASYHGLDLIGEPAFLD